jgi:hypothetical protein
MVRIEERAADKDHQVIGLRLARLPEIQQVTRREGGDVSPERSAIECDERTRVGKLGKPSGIARRHAE